jgi:hypothetical protein
MATPRTGRPSGRPKGKSSRNARRDTFVHAVVAGLMGHIGLSKRRACAVAQYLLSNFKTDLPAGWVAGSRVWTASDSSGGAWVNEPVTYLVPIRPADKEGDLQAPEAFEELTVRESSAVRAWWESELTWWMSHPVLSQRTITSCAPAAGTSTKARLVAVNRFRATIHADSAEQRSTPHLRHSR